MPTDVERDAARNSKPALWQQLLGDFVGGVCLFGSFILIWIFAGVLQ